MILTGLTTNLLVLGGTRILEGASTAASVPSILGYIALVTAGNEVLRGKAAARFEGATLAGLGVGLVIAPLLFAALGPAAFFLNALVYGVSYLIYRYGVEDRQADERAARREAGTTTARMDLGRYVDPAPDVARLAAGTDLDRRSTRRSACGSARRSSTSRGRTRTSPTSS